MDDDKFLLKLEVVGRKYPLKIARSQEQAFRYAAGQINKKVERYRAIYGGAKSELTDQDFVAMAAIQALAENFSLKDKNDTKPYENKILSVIGELDSYMKGF